MQSVACGLCASYFIGNTEIQFTDEERDLGVIVHESLKVSSQCNKVVKEEYSILGVINRCFLNKTKEILVALYKSLVRSRSHCIGNMSVLPVSAVWDLGIYIDADLTMGTHVTATVRACFAALRRIRSVQRSLTRDALLTLLRALVITIVDYCCSVLTGVSGALLQHLFL